MVASSPPVVETHSRRKIEVLPDELIDQIAAGEVIERPASVVKELVENALDAQATHIAVEVEAGGKRLIRVLDNGCGMAADEAKLALRRHATSKLVALDDLFHLRTKGFRGEALPSIAAVSKLRLTTRARSLAGEEASTGVVLTVEGGSFLDSSVVGTPVGTQVEVRELLYNVPARRKFLKGDATEAAHITDVVNKLAMAHPNVHFRLRHGARQTISAPQHRNRLERAQALLGARIGRRLHRVVGQEAGVEVEALLAAPELAQTTSRGLLLLVGDRAVRDRGLLHAVRMGYGELIPKGRYPVAVIHIAVPDGAVDVNVHPQKLEVRFSDAQAVNAAVRHVVRRGVAESPWLSESCPEASPVRMNAIASAMPPEARPVSELAASHARETTKMLLPWRPVAPAPKPRKLVDFALSSKAPPEPVPEPAPENQAAESPTAAANATATVSPAEEPELFFAQLRYLGQLDRTYLVCERAGELVLVDQHAAHERVAFQRLRERYDKRAVPVQRLLFPQTLELSDHHAAVVKECEEQLSQVGFELEPFGGTSFALKAAPAGLPPSGTVDVVRELLEELDARGGSRAVEERLDMVLATIACHSVVRAGDPLSPREVAELLSSLDGVDFRAHCPHGRPVLLRISIAEIARRFGRT